MKREILIERAARALWRWSETEPWDSPDGAAARKVYLKQATAVLDAALGVRREDLGNVPDGSIVFEHPDGIWIIWQPEAAA